MLDRCDQIATMNPTMLPRELVIARYREPLDWLRRVPPGWRITIYNKGDPFPLPSIPLPNLGREAHAYLYHLVTRRDSLARQTVFVQGHPFDHVPDLHARLVQWTIESPPPDHFHWLGFLIDRDDPEGRRLFVPWSKNPQRQTLPTGRIYHHLFRREPPPHFTFFGGAHFSLGIHRALSRSPQFFAQALHLATTEPLAAHAFERFWDRVFSTDGIPQPHRSGPFPIYLKKIRRLETAA